MKFYSELTKQLYDSIDTCKNAEKEYRAEQEAKEKAAEAERLEREALKERLAELRKQRVAITEEIESISKKLYIPDESEDPVNARIRALFG